MKKSEVPGRAEAPRSLIDEPDVDSFETVGGDAVAWGCQLVGLVAIAGGMASFVWGPAALAVPSILFAAIALVAAHYRRRGRLELESDDEHWIVRSAVGRWSRRRVFARAAVRAITTTRRRVIVELVDRSRPVRFGFGIAPDELARIAARLSAAPGAPPAVHVVVRQHRRAMAIFNLLWVGCLALIAGLGYVEGAARIATCCVLGITVFEVLLAHTGFAVTHVVRRGDRWTVEDDLGGWACHRRFWRSELLGVELNQETPLTSWAPGESWYVAIALRHTPGLAVGAKLGLDRDQAAALQRLLLEVEEVPG